MTTSKFLITIMLFFIQCMVYDSSLYGQTIDFSMKRSYNDGLIRKRNFEDRVIYEMTSDECRVHLDLDFDEWMESYFLGFITGEVPLSPPADYFLPEKLEFNGIALEVETNKTVYQLGEPIGIRLFVKNTSNAILEINQFRQLWHISIAQHLVLKGPNDIEVSPMTHQERGLDNVLWEAKQKFIVGHILLNPGERGLVFEQGCGMEVLNYFYRLNKPGTYKLMFCRKKFRMKDKASLVLENPDPHTVEFEILNEFYIPEWPLSDEKTKLYPQNTE